ncbi:MAG: hypothetical protein LM566_00780 [Pyrobaculum sp.]|nr:hypothetical protein [Pyrobaculum sp.]
MEFLILREVDEPTLKRLKELVESLGPLPIDLVIIGAEETRLEIGDVYALKVSLPLNSYKVLREVAVAHALTDPQLMEIWAVPPDVKQEELVYELSLALLNRLVDVLVARVAPTLLLERARVEVVEGETLLYTVVRTFAVDVSVSLAVAGHASEALRLVTQLSSHPIYEKYRSFWDFATANFKFLPIYNWLMLMF